MNEWFRDPRFREAEAKQIAADAAERDQRHDLAAAYHLEAAEALSRLAMDVTGDHPHTRSDLAIGAAVSFVGAGRFDHALQFAERMLANGALPSRGRGELTKIVEECAAATGRGP